MGHAYRAVGWNRQKKLYDTTLLASVLVYLVAFIALGFGLQPNATFETLLIRALATAALILLHVILCIGPLCRLDRRFLPLLYNRRHLGVTMFFLALAHGLLSLIQFHAFGDTNPFVSVFISNTRFDSISQFPFQPLGFAALVMLFMMAATSHDFWLANLTAPIWKALHMLVYVAYALIVLHVVLGVLQAETAPLLAVPLAVGVATVTSLHLVAGRREAGLDREHRTNPAHDGFVDACALSDIPSQRAKIVSLAGERVAVFRYDGKVSALSNACQHQNGPLGEGCVIDGTVTCPWHGYQYRPHDGRSPEPFTERVPTFRVRLQDERVWVHPQALPAGSSTPPAQLRAACAPADSEFYVGYLPKAPAALGRWLRPRVAALCAAALLLMAVIVALQKPFSQAVFEYGLTTELEGWISTTPYPSLRVERPAGGYSRYLLTRFGKWGADALIAGLDGRKVRLTGSLIYRDDRTMIEIADDGVEVLSETARADVESWYEDLGEQTLRGEIVDSKCFLGVMKPGNLKPHRACATRCLSGGVPPVLLVRDNLGNASYFLLASAAGEAVGQQVVERGLVAEPLEMSGRVLRYDNLYVLRADPDTYRRLP